MPFTCLSCRQVVGPIAGPPVGCWPGWGGELAGEEGTWLAWRGPEEEGVLLVTGERITIGRRADCHVSLRDGQVSKNHATLHREGEDWYLRDHCSANGTLVNGQRIAEWKLEEGDVILVGDTEIRFHAEDVPAGAGGITIVPMLDSEEAVQACLPCGPGDFMPEKEVQSEEEVRSDYERLRVAYLLNRNMGNDLDEKTLVEHILKFAFDLVPADRGALLLREEEGAPLTAALTYHRDGSGPGDPGAEVVIPDSILRRAVEERTAVLSGDASTDLRFEDSESVLREGIRSAMCVPLVGQKEVIGAIHLDTRETTGAFSVKDLRLLTMVASQAAPVIERFRLLRRLEKEAETRKRLSRFLAPEVLEEVVEKGLDLTTGGRTGRVTVLFCDIRGFSSLAETMHATQLVRMLNAFFEQMVEVIFRHGGLLDKFIGDALMAVWGAPIRRSDDAVRAMRAGRDILEAVSLFNRSGEGQGWPALRVGVGLNTGEAVIGTVGSSRRMEYTVMGDTVNLAARICNLAQGGQLLMTEKTWKEVSSLATRTPQVRDLPPATVRGRRAPVRIFEYVGS